MVNRVVLQHMSINILDTNTDNLVGLSPPSDSMMMQRRKSLQKGQSLQLNRLNNNSKVLSIQVCPSPSTTNSDSNLMFSLGPGRPGANNNVSILLK